jgi:hypothetical protein
VSIAEAQFKPTVQHSIDANAIRGEIIDRLERVAGIEPAYSAWKAAALPLSYTRGQSSGEVVERAGFEPA